MLIESPPVEVCPDVWMLGLTAYPVYLIRGKTEGMIVEGGISAIGPLLSRQLAQLGIGPGFVRRAVVTHAHPDHVMAIPLLRELFPGITVTASALAAEVLGMEKAVSFFRQIDSMVTDALSRLKAFGDKPAPVPLAGNRIVVDEIVREGDTIRVEDSSWLVLETPGHSDCSISLHNAARRTLVISDASGYYMSLIETWWPNYFTSYAAYMASLERLSSLEAEVLCLSHNGAICGAEAVRDYFAGALACTRQYHDHIVAEARAGRTARQIAEALGEEVYRQVPLLPLDFFQKNCGLMVKQSLRHAGISADK
ncbi:MAG: MBL fold metallo-hydrolase [Planctomycetes bacterium]|nr:MBL fold metallo-hydrolase [Planctomycetota bacterium]